MNPAITSANYEEYLLLRTDGELSPAEDAALDSFLAEHPELAAEAAAYAATRSTPDETVVFAEKASLLRSEAVPLTGHRTRLVPWSLAAAAVLLVAASLWTRQTPNTGRHPAGPVAAMQNTPQEKPAAPTPAPAPGKPATHPLEVALAHPVKKPAPRPEAPAHSIHKALAPQSPVERVAVARLEALPAMTVTSLTAAGEHNFSVVSVGHLAMPLPGVTAAEKHTPEPILIVQEDRAQSGGQRLLQALPINKERLEGLVSLKEAAASQLQRVKNARENLKNTEATFALAGHELFTIRF